MLKLIFLVVAGGLIAFALLPSGSQKESFIPPPQSESGMRWEYPIGTQISQSTELRRQIFCNLVEASKKMLTGSLSPPQMVAFDLSTSEQKWDFLKNVLIANGCPDEPTLLISLEINSVSDIEFGTLEGADVCHVTTPARTISPNR